MKNLLFLTAINLLFVNAFSQSALNPVQKIPSGCSVITISKGDRVFFGGNDDYINSDQRYFVEEGDSSNYGVIWIGKPDNPQQGVNEKGLAYDANGLPGFDVNPHSERIPVKGEYYHNYVMQIMHEGSDRDNRQYFTCILCLSYCTDNRCCNSCIRRYQPAAAGFVDIRFAYNISLVTVSQSISGLGGEKNFFIFLFRCLPQALIVTLLGLGGIFPVAMPLANKTLAMSQIMPLSPWIVMTWWAIIVAGSLVGAIFIFLYELWAVKRGYLAWNVFARSEGQVSTPKFSKIWWWILISIQILIVGMIFGVILLK